MYPYFAYIDNISDVLPHIDGREEFVVAVRDGFTIINYNMQTNSTFPAEHDAAFYIRRECRGIAFDNETGDIIRRPLHKFFNVNEREDTMEKNVNLSTPHRILSKLDGSMIAPFKVKDRTIWGTKMGDTSVAEPVQEFVDAHPEYQAFTDWCHEGEITPIFEWCSRKQRIVIDYPEDQLVLIAARYIHSGEYIPIDTPQMRYFGVPIVTSHDAMPLSELMQFTKDLVGEEGFVIRFADGEMVKVKSAWYVAIHKAKEKILRDRNIVELILDKNLDDIVPHLLEDEQERILDFSDAITNGMIEQVTCINEVFEFLDKAHATKKEYSLEYGARHNKYTRAVVFSCWGWERHSAQDVFTEVTNQIRRNLISTAKWNEMQGFWFRGVKYNA